MQLVGPSAQRIAEELDILQELLPLEGAHVLELGCGTAVKTRQLAEHTGVASIVAAEVDPIAHANNLDIADLPKVTFKAYGAEAIEEADAAFDIVLMFKSLHHVPLEQMDRAMREIRRVLKPGGLAYISEPVFAGDFNEVIRLFHDEETVRRAAFEAAERAVRDTTFELASETFFCNTMRMKDFSQVENGILAATHTDFSMTPERLKQVKDKFESYRGSDGFVFQIPNRVDLLRRPA